MSARHPRTRSLSLVVIDARRLILLRAMATSITAIPLGRHIPQRAASSLDAPAIGRMPLLGIIRLAISVRALQAKSLLVDRELIEVLPQVTCGDPQEDLGWQFRSVSSALTRNALVRVLAEVSISFVAGSGQVFSCSSAYRLAVDPRLRREVPKRPAAGAIGSSPAGSALLQGKRVHVTALRSLKSSMYHACGPKYSAACNSSKVSAGGPILARRLASASARLLRSSGISSWV